MQTVPELLLEYYEDLWLELDVLDARFTEEGMLDDAMSERFNDLRKVLLGAEEAMIIGDPLIAKWERELREGKVPDLDEEWHG